METLKTPEGRALMLHTWSPAQPPRGRILLVHGLGEHAQRHAGTAAVLARHGWAVHAHDQFGHGRSDGVRGGLPSSNTLVEDLALVLDRLPPVDGPTVLLGHSLGGLVAARFVAEGLAPQPAAWSRPLDALVLSSPALDPGMNAAQKLLLMLVGPLLPELRLSNGLKPDWISRDPGVVRAYVDDPLVHDRISARLARMIVDEGVAVRGLAARWRVPTLLLWAGADRCVAPAGSAAFASAAPPSVVTSQCFGALAHEIFHEPEREQVLAVLTGWLERFAAGTQG